jgi:hypothetical protein
MGTSSETTKDSLSILAVIVAASTVSTMCNTGLSLNEGVSEGPVATIERISALNYIAQIQVFIESIFSASFQGQGL